MIPIDGTASLRADLQVRPAVSSDQQKIADLLTFASHVHRHLDWRTPLDWIGSPPYWVMEEEGQLIGALACPPDPDTICWIRFFAYDAYQSGPSVWRQLWEAARSELAESSSATVAVITTQRWFESILSENGFQLTGHITLLEWNDQPAVPVPVPPDIHLRTMTLDDLPRVVEVDSAAFEPLWRNSVGALSKAYSQASYASVAEDDSGMIGYQLSTGSLQGAHLARLAVRPEMQGRGLGAALVGDLIERIQNQGGTRVTVNTQADNTVSLALYHKLGFRRTGEQYPVYIFEVK
jgi:ribosomal protein S18 acetylase RimI-like enzyme